jgi:uncharacterized membrane protein
MQFVFRIVLTIHIFGGATALLTGILNMVTRKGYSKHKIIGKVFSISMYFAGVSSLALSVLHPSYFMFMVGIFTLYMVGTGNRCLQLKLHNKNHKPKTIDWILTIVMLIAGLLFIGLGTINLLKSNFFGLVFLLFGFIGLLFIRNDFKNYRGKSDLLNFYLITHIQRMIGAFIASLTAFLVVNAKYLPEFIPHIIYWILPTVILTPFIIKWIRKHKVK